MCRLIVRRKDSASAACSHQYGYRSPFCANPKSASIFYFSVNERLSTNWTVRLSVPLVYSYDSSMHKEYEVEHELDDTAFFSGMIAVCTEHLESCTFVHVALP
jgi:hypothetical protein